MKFVGSVVGIVIVILIVTAVMLSLQSRNKSAVGLVGGRLSRCPDTPNCVCSEYPDSTAYIEPMAFEGDAAQAWERAKAAIRESGGKIVQEDEAYLAATYSSLLFRFIDDLELRMDRSAKRIHLRSASRVGHYDMGVNRKRVAKIRSRFFESAR